MTSMKKSIGILYLCTGPYVLFWEDFFRSFEEKFMPDVEKKYFVFTDAKQIYAQNHDRVRITKIEPQPWPLITLFRFATFLKVEEELEKCDYVMFSNANMVCKEVVSKEEFLPRREKGEVLSVTEHPGYFGAGKICFPYERRKESSAYVSYNAGEHYVIGAMFCGTSEAFLRMSKTLKYNIEEDLKKNIIARWHDESQLNRYIISKPGIRFLSPSYCYPCGMEVSYEAKIAAVSKQAKFDVRTFKGQNEKKSSSLRTMLGKLKRTLMLKERMFWLLDTLLQKHMGEIKDAE